MKDDGEGGKILMTHHVPTYFMRWVYKMLLFRRMGISLQNRSFKVAECLKSFHASMDLILDPVLLDGYTPLG